MGATDNEESTKNIYLESLTMITSLALCHSTARRRAPYNTGDVVTHFTALSDENQTMSNKYPEGPVVSSTKQLNTYSE